MTPRRSPTKSRVSVRPPPRPGWRQRAQKSPFLARPQRPTPDAAVLTALLATTLFFVAEVLTEVLVALF